MRLKCNSQIGEFSYSHSPRRMTQLPFRILFEKDIQSFLSGADQYALAKIFRKKVLVLIRIFLFLFLYRICSFCISIFFWKHLFLDLQTGISIEYSFLWSGSQVLLRWHSLSRRHRQYSRYFSIWRYNRSCLLLVYGLYIVLMPYFPHPYADSIFYKKRTVIKPFLYTYCVFV